MVVLLFIDSLAGGGAQRQLVNLAVGLSERQHSVHVATYFSFDTHLQRLLDADVKYRCYDKKSRWDLAPAAKLHSQIKEIEPDVVIAFLRTPAFYAELVKLLLPKTKLIVSERCGVEENGLTIRDYLPAIGHLMATHVTANSYDFLDRITHKIKPLGKKSTVIYNGVSEQFNRIGADRIAPSDNKDTSLDTVAENNDRLLKFCVVAARTTRQKGLIPLIKAMSQLSDENFRQFTIDWIGPIEPGEPNYIEAQKILDENQLNKRWRWAGNAENIQTVYPAYDAMILPSLYEGVANTMCEAMSCAVPVLATNIADNKRILANGEYGILCEPNNPQSLAQAIQSFIQMSQEERESLGKSGYERAIDLFSMPRFIDQWEQLCLNPRSAVLAHD